MLGWIYIEYPSALDSNMRVLFYEFSARLQENPDLLKLSSLFILLHLSPKVSRYFNSILANLYV